MQLIVLYPRRSRFAPLENILIIASDFGKDWLRVFTLRKRRTAASGCFFGVPGKHRSLAVKVLQPA
jgi:hypothetical protein